MDDPRQWPAPPIPCRHCYALEPLPLIASRAAFLEHRSEELGRRPAREILAELEAAAAGAVPLRFVVHNCVSVAQSLLRILSRRSRDLTLNSA